MLGYDADGVNFKCFLYHRNGVKFGAIALEVFVGDQGDNIGDNMIDDGTCCDIGLTLAESPLDEDLDGTSPRRRGRMMKYSPCPWPLGVVSR